MKCPSCKLIFSDKNDICPRCSQDMRGIKESLGIQVSNIGASVEELKKKKSETAQTPPTAAAPEPAAVFATEVTAKAAPPVESKTPEITVERIQPNLNKPAEPTATVKDADELMFALNKSVNNISETAEAVNELQFDLEVSELDLTETFEPVAATDEPALEISFETAEPAPRDPQQTIQMLAELLAEHLKTTPEKVLKDLETLHARASKTLSV